MRSIFIGIAVTASLLSSAAYADGCVYGDKTYSDGAVVNGKVCDGRAGVWR
jgi:hypothetical protein